MWYIMVTENIFYDSFKNVFNFFFNNGYNKTVVFHMTTKESGIN